MVPKLSPEPRVTEVAVLAVATATARLGFTKVIPTEFKPTEMGVETAPTGAVVTDWADSEEVPTRPPRASIAAKRARLIDKFWVIFIGALITLVPCHAWVKFSMLGLDSKNYPNPPLSYLKAR